MSSYVRHAWHQKMLLQVSDSACQLQSLDRPQKTVRCQEARQDVIPNSLISRCWLFPHDFQCCLANSWLSPTYACLGTNQTPDSCVGRHSLPRLPVQVICALLTSAIRYLRAHETGCLCGEGVSQVPNLEQVVVVGYAQPRLLTCVGTAWACQFSHPGLCSEKVTGNGRLRLEHHTCFAHWSIYGNKHIYLQSLIHLNPCYCTTYNCCLMN